MSLLSEFVDRNTKDLQKLGGGGGGGKGDPSSSIVEQNRQALAERLNLNVDQDLIPIQPNLDQDLAAPVVEAVEQITKIDAPKVVESVVTQAAQLPIKTVETAAQIGLSVAKPVMDLTKIDYAGKAGEAVQTAIDTTADTVTNVVNKLDINTEQLKPNFAALSPNLDQDLTKISLRGLQESAVKQAGGIQEGAVQVGSAVQQSLIDAGSAMQQNAIDLGSLTGKSNPTLENYAAQGTKYIEEKVVPAYADAMGTAVLQNPTVQAAKEVVNLGEKNTVGIENLGSDTEEFLAVPGQALNLLLGGASISTYGNNADPKSYSDNYASAPTFGDSTTFEGIETATGKGSQMSEEERLRRIRRLLTNRYGREKTILGGVGDTTSRRRYAV